MHPNSNANADDEGSASSHGSSQPQPAGRRLQELCQGLLWFLGGAAGDESPRQPADPASPNHQLQAQAGRILRPHLEAGLRELTEVLRQDLLVRIAYVQQLERLTEGENNSSSLSRLLQGQSRILPTPFISVSLPPPTAPPPERPFDGESAPLHADKPYSSAAAQPPRNTAATSDVTPRQATTPPLSPEPIVIEADLRQAAELWRQRSEDRALALCSRAIRQNPAVAAAYLLRGQMHAQRRQYEQAIADFTSAIAICPHHAKAYYQRARIYRAQREIDRAVADCEHSLKLQPQFKEAEACLQELRQLADAQRREPPSPPTIGFVADTAEEKEAAPLKKKPAGVGKPAEDRTGSQKEAAHSSRGPANAPRGYITLQCEECGTTAQVRIDRLHCKFQCRKCARVYTVRPDGRLTEVVRPQSPREQLKASVWKGLRLSPAACLLLLAILGGWYGWRSFVSARALPALPTELEPRVEMLVKAWLSQDAARMQMLTTPAQEDRVDAWLRANSFPLTAEELNTSRTWLRQTKIEIQARREERNRVQLQIRVSTPASPPVNLEQQWVKIGKAWYFQPFPDPKRNVWQSVPRR